MQNAGLAESQAGIRIVRRNNLRYADDTTLMAELKSLLMRVKEESEKAGLNLNIQKAKIMASGLITSWQIEGEKVEAVTYFILGAPKSLQKVTAAIKRLFILGRKAMTNLDIILKTGISLCQQRYV